MTDFTAAIADLRALALAHGGDLSSAIDAADGSTETGDVGHLADILDEVFDQRCSEEGFYSDASLVVVEKHLNTLRACADAGLIDLEEVNNEGGRGFFILPRTVTGERHASPQEMT